ncbi:class I SAM-dependent methyltransferase [Paracraurococcus lichenis]|uniref:Class I SAM-dependent methyltransferase n=1 Tax=Paracraurococcus lichenis TaxID=3064888 RepID=A0ABT9E0P9_9PROT|nr:class I SAM-dependent methyltransferase [Paracraurococcus sp. LOR1-02]MDO9709714.1 class I SAM-dependent methyltransferase [Paracraurococcus sp. LOR1-02]
MIAEACTPIRACRCCGGGDLVSVFDMGTMPPSDALSPSATEPDPAYPLEVIMCRSCGLAQLRHTVAPEVLFSAAYKYFSSYTQTVVDNAKDAVATAIERVKPAPGALAVELASNDGYLLKHAKAAGLSVLGIDPAPAPVAAAREAGIDTIQAFFSEDLARKLKAEGRQAMLLFGNNVLAHVADTAGFVRGIREILHPEGTASIEVPYLRDLIDHVEFDTIYHEHLCYFSVSALSELFKRQGLHLNDVQRIPIHGGSLRLFIQHKPAPSERMLKLIEEEKELGLDRPESFRAFAAKVEGVGQALRELIDGFRREGKRIAAYGAAAKGTILLNFFKIGPEELMWVADKNPHKHGLYMPGIKLPIVGVERIEQDRPDCLVILPWNHQAEIMRQQADFAAQGGRFIIPIPHPHLQGG